MPPKDLREKIPRSSGDHEGFIILYPVFRALAEAKAVNKSPRKRTDREIVGDDSSEGTPVPIPNTEVKLAHAEDTWLVTARENR